MSSSSVELTPNNKVAQQSKNCLLLTHSPLNHLYPPVRIHTYFLPLVTASVLTIKDNLYQLACAGRRDLIPETL